MDDRTRLLEIIRDKSLRFGTFTLSSGKTSDYYLDCRLTTLDSEGAYRSARALLAHLGDEKIEADAIGGPTIGADPIVGAVAALSFEKGNPMSAFLVRGEAKAHGRKRLIEGDVGEGTRVVVVDDVVTSAGSILRAIRACEEAGCEVVAVSCLVDREEGGREALTGYRFVPLFTRAELLERRPASG
jgi:orotate phosphoribosyltransferase